MDDEESIPESLSEDQLVIIQSTDDYIYIGAVAESLLPGIAIKMLYFPLDEDDISQEGLAEAQYAHPIDTFIPWSNIRYIQSFTDMLLETEIEDFVSAIEEYSRPPSAKVTVKEEPKDTLWTKFLKLVDKLLQSVGV